MLRIFQIMCLVTFLVVAWFQFQTYLENKDSSSVGYRRFNDEKRDIYPAFSICLNSRQGKIFDDKLLGNLGQDGGKRYQEILLGNENMTNDFDEISYENVTRNFFDDFVEVFFTMTKQGDVVDTWQPNTKDHPFFKSYQDPYFICMTKKVKYVQNQLLNLGSLVIKASAFYKSNIENLLVYMHHPGQLTRQFGKQILHLTPASFMKVSQARFTSNYVK